MNVPDLFNRLGGTSAVARILGVGQSTASEMKRSGSVSVKYWPRLIEAAAERGLEGVTYETLVHMHVRPPGSQVA